MQIVEIVQQVLKTGELPMSLERQMQNCLVGKELNKAEMEAIDQLIDAICKGKIRSVPDSRKEEMGEGGDGRRG
ncbi:MAG: hypothetical protein WCA35_08070 [Kovacikia sp.]